MGPINWLAAGLSAFLAVAIGAVWYGPLFGGRDLYGRAGEGQGSSRLAGIGAGLVAAIVLQGYSAVMLAHNFARIGAATLAVKPWLYWMQSGGLALGFVIPALWISYRHHAITRRDALVDAGFWLVVYLATGTLFWALR